MRHFQAITCRDLVKKFRFVMGEPKIVSAENICVGVIGPSLIMATTVNKILKSVGSLTTALRVSLNNLLKSGFNCWSEYC